MSAISAAQAVNYSLPMADASSISFPGIAFTISVTTTPAVIAALREELERNGPAMVQSHVAESAGELAEKLCRRAGRQVDESFFSEVQAVKESKPRI